MNFCQNATDGDPMVTLVVYQSRTQAIDHCEIHQVCRELSRFLALASECQPKFPDLIKDSKGGFSSSVPKLVTEFEAQLSQKSRPDLTMQVIQSPQVGPDH